MKDLRAPTVFEFVWGMAGALLLWLLMTLSTCSPKIGELDRIRAQGELRVATINSPTTYYLGTAGPTGFEYEIARGFAKSLGVPLKIVVKATPEDVVEAVGRGEVHLGAAGIAISPEHESRVRFTRSLRSVQPQLVLRESWRRPKNPEKWTGRLALPPTVPEATVTQLRAQLPLVTVNVVTEADPEELLYRVAEKKLDFTVAPSDLVAIHQRYNGQLQVAFDAGARVPLAWCVGRSESALHTAAETFLAGISEKKLAQLKDRLMGAGAARVNPYNAEALREHVQSRLPRYRLLFEREAKANNLDWRFLAAVGYQESRWDPSAVSPTGVRGIMQITAPTAAFLKIEDRLDPAQSIDAAARYLVHLKSELPPSIPEPDRTWMTLASYNLGLGHLLDARRLTQMRGDNPNRWSDVREALPLLTQFKWFSQTKYGYARGYEAMAYVDRVRSYQDMLVWISEGRRGQPPPELEATDEAEPEKERLKQPLNIVSPVL